MEELKLTIEQKFSVIAFREQVKTLTHEQAQQFCVDLYQQMVVKEAYYKEFLAQAWGIKP